MKPPDILRGVLLFYLCYLGIFVRDASSQQGPSRSFRPLSRPPPPLLNIYVPSMSKATLPAEHATTRNEVVSKKSSVVEVNPYAQSVVVNSTSPSADAGAGDVVTQTSVQATVTEQKETPDDKFAAEENAEIVTKTSVQGSIVELGPQGPSGGLVDGVGDAEDVTRTSLKVSGVELGENGEVVSSLPEDNLQDAVTQTSIKFTQQEVQEDSEQKRTLNSTGLSGDLKTGVENIQEILKQIQNEVGEAQVLYVADPKAKKGVRIAHQPTELPTVTAAPPVYNAENEDDDYDNKNFPLPLATTPISIVKLKKLKIPKKRPSVVRTRPMRLRDKEVDGVAVAPIKSRQPKQDRPAFGIFTRPKKPTGAPGVRTVRPIVKIFDRARDRPKSKQFQPVRIRKPGKRITTAKPERKPYPFGPPRSAPSLPSAPSGPSLADFEELYRRQKGQHKGYETSTYRTVEEDVPDDFGEPDLQVPLVYYEGQTKIIDGWEWSPYLDDRNTKEFKYLAFHVKQQLKSFLDDTRYGDFLNYILIDGFSKGVEVDFFLVFYQTEPMIDDQELTEDVRDVMAYKSDNDFEFVLDPNMTSFKFKYVKTPASELLVEPPLLPNWAIAMLVFGFGSLVLIAGSLIMANNFRSNRRLKDIKKKKLNEKELQLQMTSIPHRYSEAVKKSKEAGKSGKTEPLDTKSSGSAHSSKSYCGSVGTLDKRPPMLERYQRDYGVYKQTNPPSDRICGEHDDHRQRRRKNNENRRPKNGKSQQNRGETCMDPDPAPLGDGYSTIGSHFPSSFKSLLQPSKSILYRPSR